MVTFFYLLYLKSYKFVGMRTALSIFFNHQLTKIIQSIFAQKHTSLFILFSCFSLSIASPRLFKDSLSFDWKSPSNTGFQKSLNKPHSLTVWSAIENKRLATPLCMALNQRPHIHLNDTNKKKSLHLPVWIMNMIRDTMSSKKPRFLIYPTIGYSPETKWEFGVSAITVFHYNNDTNLRLSEISAFTFYTQEKQLGLWMDHAIYGKNNNIFALGKMRFQNYPLSFYGIGSDIPKKPVALIDATYYNVRERLIYKLSNNLYAGFEFDYQQMINPKFNPKGMNQYPLPPGSGGSQNLGIGFGLILDSRHNMLNVRDGYLAEVAYINYSPLFETSFPMNTLFFDGRYFIPTSKNQVLAMQVVGQFSSGDVPFNQLSLMGGETMMRGYYLGRYRDKNYLAAQIEYRFLPFNFQKRLGGAVFGSLGSVSNTIPVNNYKWSTGVGLRYLLFPKKDIFSRVDVGFNPDGYGIYFYVGEAF